MIDVTQSRNSFLSAHRVSVPSRTFSVSHRVCAARSTTTHLILNTSNQKLKNSLRVESAASGTSCTRGTSTGSVRALLRLLAILALLLGWLPVSALALLWLAISSLARLLSVGSLLTVLATLLRLAVLLTSRLLSVLSLLLLALGLAILTLGLAILTLRLTVLALRLSVSCKIE